MADRRTMPSRGILSWYNGAFVVITSRQSCMNVIHTTLESWRRKFHWGEPIMSLRKRTILQHHPYTIRAKVSCKYPQGIPARQLGRTARVPIRQVSSVASRRARTSPVEKAQGSIVRSWSDLQRSWVMWRTPSGPVVARTQGRIFEVNV